MTRKELLAKAKPILFNTEMVKAILEGRKTVTRRAAFPADDFREFHTSLYPDGVPRIASGIKDRAGRLKCLGNAVVPQQFYPVFQAIADIGGNR